MGDASSGNVDPLDATEASAGSRDPVDHTRLTELFTRAIEMPVNEREQWLAELRAKEPAFERALISLLRADAGSGLRTADFAPAVREYSSAPTVTIPGYVITHVIGEGGMGTVYAGEQEEPKRPVAIKVLHARSASALARFRTEAQIMARLDHPGIARVLEAGDAGGEPFLVMEHVDGKTLDTYSKGLPLERKLALFAALCDAVHYAHVKGVIHRDLKPANVMVRDGDRVVVLDFGVARLEDSALPSDTRAGDMLGTPVYMSPEQASLRPEEVDARSDGYTLGVIMYELICGELPHDVRGMSLPVVTAIIVTDDPVPLSKREPAVARDLEAITVKALQKQPVDRYPSVAALGEDVRRYLAHLPVSVRLPSLRERFFRFIKRRPILAASIASAVLAVTAFAIVVTMLWQHARTAQRAAESRNNQLVLLQARDALERDPTTALEWLAALTERDTDSAAAWGIAREAIGRGVAKDVLREHSDEVHWVESLPTGDGFVTGGYDGKAFLWRGTPPISAPLYTTSKGRVHVVRPSPDGQVFAIGGDFGQLHVVTRDGRVIADLGGHEGDVQHVAWSPGGSWLASADDQGHVYVWSHGATPGKLLVSGASAVGTIAFGSDDVLVAGFHDGTVERWDLKATTDVALHLDHDVDEVWADPTHVTAVDRDGTVRSWRFDAGALVVERVVETDKKIKRSLFAPSGWVLLGGVGGSVVLVDGEHVQTISLHHSQVRSLAISSDGRWLADGGDGGELYVHDRTTGRELSLRGHKGRIRHLAFASGGTLLSSDSDGVVRQWELASISHDVLEGDSTITEVAASADGANLATVDANGDVALWNVANGTRSVRGTIGGRVRELAVAGGVVITGTAEGDVTWWTDTPVTVKLDGSVESLAASTERVAVASSKGPISLFTLSGERREVLPGHAGGTLALAFDPTGTLLASGGQDRDVRLWRRTADRYVADVTLGGFTADTHFVAFSPDGTQLVAAGNDGMVVRYVVRSLAVEPARTVLAKHVGAITALAVDDRAVTSAGRDSTVIRTSSNGTNTSVTLHSAATQLASTDSATYAITRAGALERWTGTRATVEIDHGAHAALRSNGRWIYAVDNAIVLADPSARPFAELRSALSAATHLSR
ncbi:MAG TPA: serine/threonine-protein kinase [Kofleriaceae bacterium]|jgi:serine/threonine protein kinase/WD40 repeat protein